MTMRNLPVAAIALAAVALLAAPSYAGADWEDKNGGQHFDKGKGHGKAKPVTTNPLKAEIFCHTGSPPPCPQASAQVIKPQDIKHLDGRIPASPTRMRRCGWVMLEKCITHAIEVPKGFNPTAEDAVLDLATATRGDLLLVPTLTPAAITILSQEEMKAYGSIAQFATKLCSKTSVDLSSVNVIIGDTVVRGTGQMRGRGFSCRAGEGSYKVDDHRIILDPKAIKL